MNLLDSGGEQSGGSPQRVTMLLPRAVTVALQQSAYRKTYFWLGNGNLLFKFNSQSEQDTIRQYHVALFINRL